MAINGWIVDKSVAARYDDPGVLEQLRRVEAPLLLCEVGMLEQLYSSRNAIDYDLVAETLHANFGVLLAPPDLLTRALTLQRDLAHHHGLWHRRPIPDLLIAVTALFHDVGVVHADADFEMIAQVCAVNTHKIIV